MPTSTLLPLADAPLDEVCDRLAQGGFRRKPSGIRWRLSPPEGEGLVVLGPGRSVALLAPVALSEGGCKAGAFEVAAVVGEPGERAEIARTVESEGVGPLIAVGRSSPLPGMDRRARLRHWVTGPDPFVPLQVPIEEWTEVHAEIAREREGRWGTFRSLDRLRWRYEQGPNRTLTAMQVFEAEGPVGWVAVEEQASPRLLRVLELHALSRTAHYALLKAVRRLSWDRGSPPISLPGAAMSRRYAFTAGYLPSGVGLSVFASPGAPTGDYRAFAVDARVG